MQPRNLAQAFARRGARREAFTPGGNRLFHRPLEDRDQQVVLAAEVEVDRSGRDAGAARHVGHLGIEEAARRERLDRGAKNRVALVGLVGTFGEGGRRGGGAVTAMNECSFIRWSLSMSDGE